MSRDAFVTEEHGGLIDEYTFEVTRAYFATAPAYTEKVGEEMLFLHWLGKSDVEGYPIMDEDGFHPSWKTGKPKKKLWTSVDGGKTAQHPDGLDHFDSRSDMGELVNRVEKITEHIANTPDDPLGGDDSQPTKADWWVGTKWRMKKETRTYNINGQDRTKEIDLPVEYLGKAGAAAPAAPVAAAAPVSNGGGASSAALRAKLIALINASPDFATFQVQALALEGIANDDALLNSVVDESGLWSEIKG